jgi:hypothetical protein
MNGLRYYGEADERDLELAVRRQLHREMLGDNACEPLEGDYAQFGDGTRHRVAYAWRRRPNWDHRGVLDSVQAARVGSFYWQPSGRMSYSGSLFRAIPAELFRWHGERADAPCWLFHHDVHSAGRGVDVTARVRIWHTSAPVPTV